MGNHSEKNTRLIQSFIGWCKREIRSITIIGSIGVVFAGIQTYKACSSPDIASEINDVIESTIKEHDALEPVIVPDSLFEQNSEVRLLKSFQDEYNIYLSYLRVLDLSDVSEGDDTERMSAYLYRFKNVSSYQTEVTKILQLTAEVVEYENSIKNEHFVSMIKRDLVTSALDVQRCCSSENDVVIQVLSGYLNKDLDKLTSKERKEMYKVIHQGYASESHKKAVLLHAELFKSIYVAVSIRLKELIRVD